MQKHLVIFLALFIIIPFAGRSDVIFEDDFESYTVGDQLACVNPENWQTWSNEPCGDEDPFIEFNGSNVVEITGVNDLVYDIPNYTSGWYYIEFDILIPTGSDGYFNILHEFESWNTEWGMQVYFGHDDFGIGNIDAGEALAAPFVFQYDTWIAVKVWIDLENDWAEFYLNENLIHGWVWSTGTFGTGTLCQIGGVNYYAWDGGVNGQSTFHIDNFYFDDWPSYPPCHPPENVMVNVINQNQIEVAWESPLPGGSAVLGYYIWKNGSMIEMLEPVTSYIFEPLPPGYYEICISTFCEGWGESDLVCDDTTIEGNYLFPPQNLWGPMAVGLNDPYIICWDSPGDSLWIQWDDGQNQGNGIGYVSGGTINVASRWHPSDLIDYEGLSLSKIAFFPSDDPDATFTLKAWTGYNGNYELLSQPVEDYTVNEWNEITLDEPVLILDNMPLWFGYEVTHNGGTTPIGVDEGPAVMYKGDMIMTPNGWRSLMAEYGLNFNWNLAGFLKYFDNTSELTNKPVDFKSSSDGILIRNNPPGISEIFNPEKNGDDLLGYNIYRDGSMYSFTTDLCFEDMIYLPDYMHTYCVTALYDEGESECSNEIEVNLYTGIAKNKEISLALFPNPANNLLIIQSGSQINFISVYNSFGQELLQKDVYQKETILNTSYLDAGVYFISIEFENEVIKKRLIIQ